MAEYEIVEREFHVGVDKGLFSFGGDFIAQGSIEAGLDLTELDGGHIKYEPDTQTYKLLLPSPQLTKCDVGYIRLVNNDPNLLNPDFDLLRLLGEVQVMARFIERALERGIIEDAKDSAALILEDVVGTFTGKQVRTEYEAQRGKPSMDTSCEPHVSGWTYNINTNVWKERQ
ncbi:MAG: DUF4230 domain-containing protein [Chloroflexota bacterium]|nr:DUF4230 domain-containing protein [Chloroflexota bacterium]MDE2948739.1 DUF4230 domain-containing protein [Chloroflexota bacterium]